MADILTFRRQPRTLSDVSTGTSGPLNIHSPTEAAVDVEFLSETSAARRYSPEMILGLPALIKEISDIYARCRHRNWNDEGANAVPVAAYMHTLQLLSDLPTDLPLPSAHPDSDGYIELEWYNAGKTLSILIGARPTLFWAGYYSEDKRRSGREPFDRTFPIDLAAEVRKVYA
jgi:hypothetical protein